MAATLWWDEPDSSSSSRSNHQNKKQQEELSVFGYACKLFRDDERAKEIDQGNLLIPWMGNESLMIDRYDGRGHLFDLVAHDAANVVDKNPELSEEEKAVEKACDEERYLELYRDVQEEAMYEEEEWKRYYLALQEGYQAVGFSYDQQQKGADTELNCEDEKEEEEIFVVPKELNVPASVVQPTCSKQNARIEKTANFIAQHGIQMEIMLKTRQAGNPQFNFLRFEDVLNPYYKHVVTMIKSGRYKPQATEEEKDGSEENYLHPSLSSTTTQVPLPPPPPQKAIELPKVAIHDTPYGALINSIKRYSAAASSSPTNRSPAPEEDHESQPVVDYNLDVPKEMKPTALYATAASTLYGPALEEQLCEPSSPTNERNSHKKRRRRRRRSRSSSSDSSSSSSSSSSRSQSSHKRKRSKSPSPEPRPRPEGPSAILQPPAEIRPIIDRMALYVAKNGIEFEIVVMGRNDPRFQFLNEYHAYFPYYRLKREEFLMELGRELETKSSKKESKESGVVSVSFSIKAKSKEAEPVPASKSKLFYYDSSEGEEGKEQESVSETPSRTATPPPKAQGDEQSVNAEEKVKDKLASAVKERITQSSKEKNLQAERKKKAAMFLTLLKTNQAQPSSPPVTEDAASLYVGESASSSAVVYEYDNQHMPHRIDRARSSPRERRRHRKSPTPPSAYNLERRSPNRPSPPRRQARGNQWSSGWDRDRDYSWSRRHTDYGKSPPPRKEEKKKKHKRSRSRSPSKMDRFSDRTRHQKEKSKHKPKDKDKSREKKKKSRHSRSKEREVTKKSNTKPPRESSTSDVEVIETAPEPKSKKSSSHTKVTNGNPEKHKKNEIDQVYDESLQVDIPLPDSNSSELDSRLYSDLPDVSASGILDVDKSDSQDGVASQKTDDTSSASSVDLRNKVRAMLKRSREMILKEESFAIEDT